MQPPFQPPFQVLIRVQSAATFTGMRTTKKQRDSRAKGAGSAHFRSRISAGLTLLPSVDGRSTVARVVRDVYRALIQHCGGDEVVTEPTRLLIRRIACYEAELVNLENQFAQARLNDEEPSPKRLDLYNRIVGGQRRALEALGFERRQKDITGLAELLVEAA